MLATGAALSLLLVGAASAQAAGAASGWFATAEGKVRLVAPAPATGGAGTVRLGLDFVLAPGWKIYWRSPGDVGLPPEIDWHESTNLAAAALAWPAPRRFAEDGLETIGYEGEVVLPVTVRLVRPGVPLGLRVRLTYLTCRDICIPRAARLVLDLPSAGAAGPGFAALIARFAAAVPGPATAGGLTLERVRLLAGSAPRLVLDLASTSAPLAAPDAFVEGPPGLVFAAPRVTLGASGGSARLDLAVTGDRASLARLAGPLRLTIVDGGRSLETAAVPAPVALP